MILGSWLGGSLYQNSHSSVEKNIFYICKPVIPQGDTITFVTGSIYTTCIMCIFPQGGDDHVKHARWCPFGQTPCSSEWHDIFTFYNPYRFQGHIIIWRLGPFMYTLHTLELWLESQLDVATLSKTNPLYSFVFSIFFMASSTHNAYKGARDTNNDVSLRYDKLAEIENVLLH